MATGNFGHVTSPSLRIERFGDSTNLFFTVRNNGPKDLNDVINIDVKELNIPGKISARELVSDKDLKTESNKINVSIPAGRTQVIQIKK